MREAPFSVPRVENPEFIPADAPAEVTIARAVFSVGLWIIAEGSSSLLLLLLRAAASRVGSSVNPWMK
jgi:hypothetical protein